MAVLRASNGVAAGLMTTKSASQPGKQIAHHPTQPHGLRRARRVLPPQVLGRRATGRLGLPLTAHVVGSQHGVERAERRAAAHIAGQAVGKAHAVGAVRSQRSRCPKTGCWWG